MQNVFATLALLAAVLLLCVSVVWGDMIPSMETKSGVVTQQLEGLDTTN